ncbi:hypothetical protein V6N11_029970 [Hibiscus sabdariffa]|uniref:Ysc84 actin-binding domain-containing protein n=1 Tax=Hibiscus sabdariffa TaxID=183260 RepID=A0ABR2PJN8_9ROSI
MGCSAKWGELMDFIIVLHDSKAVKTFCSRMHFSFGVGCSAAAGLVGRVLQGVCWRVIRRKHGCNKNGYQPTKKATTRVGGAFLALDDL